MSDLPSASASLAATLWGRGSGVPRRPWPPPWGAERLCVPRALAREVAAPESIPPNAPPCAEGAPPPEYDCARDWLAADPLLGCHALSVDCAAAAEAPVRCEADSDVCCVCAALC
jgi:hypothetical protein